VVTAKRAGEEGEGSINSHKTVNERATLYLAKFVRSRLLILSRFVLGYFGSLRAFLSWLFRLRRVKRLRDDEGKEYGVTTQQTIALRPYRFLIKVEKKDGNYTIYKLAKAYGLTLLGTFVYISTRLGCLFLVDRA
jgi:hypothetical protein